MRSSESPRGVQVVWAHESPTYWPGDQVAHLREWKQSIGSRNYWRVTGPDGLKTLRINFMFYRGVSALPHDWDTIDE